MFSIHRCLSIRTLVMAAGLLPGFCDAADKDEVDKKSNDTAKQTTKELRPAAYLGILVEELPPAVASQLPAVVSPEQGVLVADVIPDSPAAKAGIKPHDILLSYDNQKLFAAEQLIKLVHVDKPGRKVNLELVRAGKLQSDLVTLAERHDQGHVATPPASSWRSPRFPWARRSPAPVEQPGWGSFDSMTLKKLDDKRFHASIQHTDKSGKLQKHEFEGTADEIHKQIMSDKDMLPNERAHLLRGLDLETRGRSVFWIPEREFMFDF